MKHSRRYGILTANLREKRQRFPRPASLLKRGKAPRRHERNPDRSFPISVAAVPNRALIASMWGPQECRLRGSDPPRLTISYRWNRHAGFPGVERCAGGSQRRLLSCHIRSDRAVNKGPMRPPGPLHSRMQVAPCSISPSAARLSTTETL